MYQNSQITYENKYILYGKTNILLLNHLYLFNFIPSNYSFTLNLTGSDLRLHYKDNCHLHLLNSLINQLDTPAHPLLR